MLSNPLPEPFQVGEPLREPPLISLSINCMDDSLWLLPLGIALFTFN